MSKRVIITGGTGLLGSELSLRLLEDGYEVITTTTKREKVSELMNKAPGLIVRKVDFLNDADIKKFENYIESIGSVDFLINNARSLEFLKSNKIGLCSTDHFMSEFRINVAVPMRLCNFLINAEIIPEGIINISSQYGAIVPNPSLYDNLSEMSPIQYNVSKAALDKLTKELAVRLSPFGTRANGIAYGGIKGRANDNFIMKYQSLAVHSGMLDLHECYGPLRWLMSSDSKTMNGQIIDANKGWSLC